MKLIMDIFLNKINQIAIIFPISLKTQIMREMTILVTFASYNLFRRSVEPSPAKQQNNTKTLFANSNFLMFCLHLAE